MKDLYVKWYFHGNLTENQSLDIVKNCEEIMEKNNFNKLSLC